ncbi:MAG: MBL fold metallo-hydrolase [Bdellovibrionales bacterium]
MSTEATKDLCEILLPDSGFLQEEEASYRNKTKTTKHSPALPLYTERDGRNSIQKFVPKKLNEFFETGPFKIKFLEAGHILGAASVYIECDGKTIVFSGDLGRFDDLLMTSPSLCPDVNYVVMESTYGDRIHSNDDPIEVIGEILERLIPQKGVLMIPSFAVGRAQQLMYIMYEIFKKYPHLKVPVFLNSPMATNVTHLFKKHADEHKLSPYMCDEVFGAVHYVQSVEESKQLNESHGPMVIISASGMLTGGRIVHHLKAFAGSANNAILLAVSGPRDSRA